MNILGSIYIVDQPHINVLLSQLASTPPPSCGGKVLCMDMDETQDEIEKMFPDHTVKATLFCPPPSAMYKEIDGDQEGFITDYNNYLDYDNAVQDYIAAMLYFMHTGGNITLYSPAVISDGATWLNTLMIFFYTRYGIVIGTETTPSSYDDKYDAEIATFLYEKGHMDVIDYCNSYPNNYFPDARVADKVYFELAHIAGPYENPQEVYTRIANNVINYGVPILRPAVTFLD
jgi:hypothetical protein